jgi:hypothetical protein
MAALSKKTQKALSKPTPAVAAPKPAPVPEPVTPAVAQPAPAPVAQPAEPTKPKAKPRPAKKFADIDTKAVATSVIKITSRNPDGSIRNPKVAGGAPAKRFALYQDGMTVAQALAAGVTEADVRWDLAHLFIALQ